jgi:hypothetical protein
MRPTPHLTPDELDAFHSGSLASDPRLHLETCADCQQLALADRDLVQQLGRLPPLQARPDLSDRVMARVSIGPPVAVPILSFPRLTRERRAVLVALAAGIMLSVVWSAANRALLDQWLSVAGSSVLDTGWAAVRAVTVLAAQLPWYRLVRDLATDPMTAILLALALLVVFAAGLVVLRRLIAPSAATVSSAGT